MTTPESIRLIYAELDDALNRRAGGSIGFDMLAGSTPHVLEPDALEAWRSRYQTIKKFQEQALALFRASLGGECDPAFARMAVGDLPDALGVAYHGALTNRQHHTPTFFRTDEVAPGTLAEVQCPGSAWDIASLLNDLYVNHRDVFGCPRVFDRTLPTRFAEVLARHIGRNPTVHHLTDNSSRPQGMRYFVQRTREEGVRYFGFDGGVAPGDCNFVRSHDFFSLRYHNFFDERLERLNAGTCRFDLPPSALFDSKLIMAWPFWSRTRQYFTDEVRTLFPFTSVITPEGVELEDRMVTLDELLNRAQSERNYYVKYAGTDLALNWGSRAVFLVRGSSLSQRRELIERIERGWNESRHWIVQPSIRSRSRVEWFTREGDVGRMDANTKWSAFYGPEGLLAILVFHRNFHKVHGSQDTVMSLVY